MKTTSEDPVVAMKSKSDMNYKTLKKACEYIYDTLGTCPVDLHDWKPDYDCNDACASLDPSNCWMTYFAQLCNMEDV